MILFLKLRKYATSKIIVVGVNTLDIGVATGGCQDRSGDSDMVDTGHDLSLVVMVWQVMDQLDR